MAKRYILSFDTSAAHCAAALHCVEPTDTRLIAARGETLAKGQAERLFDMLEELLVANEIAWSDLAAIGVGVGPGNFTGIRISVSAARGLALSLDRPAIGVSSLDVAAYGSDLRPVVPGPRDRFYTTQNGRHGLVHIEEINFDAVVRFDDLKPADVADRIGRIAGARIDGPHVAPIPLYVKPADAAPSRSPAPEIIR